MTDVIDRGLQAWKDRDVEAFAACYAEDAVLQGPGGLDVHGRDGARQFYSLWNEACPDNEIEITATYACGDVVVQEGIFHGTQTGNLMTPTGQAIPPTGQRMDGEYADVFKLAGDQIVSDRIYFDQMQLLMQLGLVPEPEAAAAG